MDKGFAGATPMPLNRGKANNLLSSLQEHSLQLIKVQIKLGSYSALHLLINDFALAEKISLIY